VILIADLVDTCCQQNGSTDHQEVGDSHTSTIWDTIQGSNKAVAIVCDTALLTSGGMMNKC
jgi:hypothetical protein